MKNSNFNGKVVALISTLVVFILGWCATDILDNQNVFSPHTIFNSFIGIDNASFEESTDEYTIDGSYVVISVKSARIRSAAGTNNEILSTASKGSTFNATDKMREDSDNNIWYELSLPSGDTGWIREDVCEYNYIAPIQTSADTKEESTTSSEENAEVDDSSADEISSTEESADKEEESSSEEISSTEESADKEEESSSEEISDNNVDDSTYVIDRLTDSELENRLPDIVAKNNFSATYNPLWKVALVIVHIISIIIVAIILLIIIVLLCPTESVDKGLIAIIFVILACFGLFIYPNTQYRYSIKDKYEIVSINSNNDIYEITYVEDNQEKTTTIDTTTQQLLSIPGEDSSQYIYVVQKKTKNIFYWITEMNPQERTLYLIY